MPSHYAGKRGISATTGGLFCCCRAIFSLPLLVIVTFLTRYISPRGVGCESAFRGVASRGSPIVATSAPRDRWPLAGRAGTTTCPQGHPPSGWPPRTMTSFPVCFTGKRRWSEIWWRQFFVHFIFIDGGIGGGGAIKSPKLALKMYFPIGIQYNLVGIVVLEI